MKIVINTCFGGFGLSNAAVLRYAEIKGVKLYCDPYVRSPFGVTTFYTVPLSEVISQDSWSTMTKEKMRESNTQRFSYYDIARDDPALVQTVEEMGAGASGRFGTLKIVEIPDGVEYSIEKYDGLEHIAEAHRTWS
jgi:hypothetical protein